MPAIPVAVATSAVSTTSPISAYIMLDSIWWANPPSEKQRIATIGLTAKLISALRLDHYANRRDWRVLKPSASAPSSEEEPVTVRTEPFALHPDRLFPAEPALRETARSLYASVKDLPIVSPHGHTEPRWFADDAPFPDPARLFIVPDHYVHRMLFSQGIRPETVGVPRIDGGPVETDPRKIWRIFAENSSCSPARRVAVAEPRFHQVFGIRERLTRNADNVYDHISACLIGRNSVRAPCSTGSASRADDHRDPARRPSPAQGDQGERLDGPGGHRLPSRPGGRSRLSPISPATWRRTRPDHRQGYSRVGQTISRRSPIAAAISRESAAVPRPTMAIRPPSPPICPRRRPRRCSTACATAAPAPRTPNCSAARC